MNHDTAEYGVLEQDTLVPEDETLSIEEMDTACNELLASSQAYAQGKLPMRETKFVNGKSFTSWRFVNGEAADLYTIIINRTRPMTLFTASVLELPGCSASGVTQEEALDNVRHEINNWIEKAFREGHEIPMPPEESVQEAKAVSSPSAQRSLEAKATSY